MSTRSYIDRPSTYGKKKTGEQRKYALNLFSVTSSASNTRSGLCLGFPLSQLSLLHAINFRLHSLTISCLSQQPREYIGY